MGVWVGIDVAKEVHWACAVDDNSQVLLDRRVDNDPAAIAALIEDLGALGRDWWWGWTWSVGSPTWSRPCSPWPASGWSMCLGWR